MAFCSLRTAFFCAFRLFLNALTAFFFAFCNFFTCRFVAGAFFCSLLTFASAFAAFFSAFFSFWTLALTFNCFTRLACFALAFCTRLTAFFVGTIFRANFTPAFFTFFTCLISFLANFLAAITDLRAAFLTFLILLLRLAFSFASFFFTAFTDFFNEVGQGFFFAVTASPSLRETSKLSRRRLCSSTSLPISFSTSLVLAEFTSISAAFGIAICIL